MYLRGGVHWEACKRAGLLPGMYDCGVTARHARRGGSLITERYM